MAAWQTRRAGWQHSNEAAAWTAAMHAVELPDDVPPGEGDRVRRGGFEMFMRSVSWMGYGVPHPRRTAAGLKAKGYG